MNQVAVKLLKIIMKPFILLVSSTKIGRYISELIINDAMNRTLSVRHKGHHLKFSTPNWITRWRAETFSVKEPETLEWIEKISEGSVYWDIGANVGIYSCYAAKRGIKVIAFEPSVFNLEMLSRNIFINDLTDQITIVPLPLSDKLILDTINMTNTTWGGALSTFGKGYTQDGSPLNMVFKIPTVGISICDAVNFLNIPTPDYIKLDVDGIEHLVLSGGVPILKEVKGILVEIDDNFSEQSESTNTILTKAGFSLLEKHNIGRIYGSSAMNTYNQIWEKLK